MHSIKHDPNIFNSKINHAIDYVLDENTEEMTKLAILGVNSLPPKVLEESTIVIFTKINTSSEQQLEIILSIISEYSKADKPVPHEVITFIADQANKSTNEKIRTVATDLLKTLIQSSQVEVPEELKRQLEWDKTFQRCAECKHGRECKTILQEILTQDLKDLSFSASTSLAFSQLLKRDDFHKFAKFYLKLVHRFLDEKISITHEFIYEVVSKYGELCEYEEYVTTLLKMVTIYDQFNWEPVSYYAVKEIHDPENPLMNTWLQILVILSQRNIQFDDKIIKQICRSLIRKTEDNLYEAL